MIEKTEAIVLRITPYAKTSHVVTWLTAGGARLVTVIKGAQRPKSAFLGQYDLFYTCELLYYARERNGVHVAKDCVSTNPRESMRSDWRAAACASYICDLINQITAHSLHQPEFFDLASSSLDFLCANAPVRPQFLSWFDLALARSTGLAPRLTRCPACDRPLPDAGQFYFSSRRGGIVCPDCVEPADRTGAEVTPDVIAMLRNWQGSSTPRSAHNTRCTRDQLDSLHEIMGIFLHYHLDFDSLPRSRQIAYGLMMKKS